MTTEKRNGKLTKREIVRRIANRAAFGATSDTYNMKYVARRIGRDVKATRQIVHYVIDNLTGYQVKDVGANFVFSY